MIAVSVMGANRGPARSLIEIVRGEATRRPVLAVVPSGYLADELASMGSCDVVTHDFEGRFASSARLAKTVRTWVKERGDSAEAAPLLFANGIGAALRAIPAVAGARIPRLVLHVHPSHLARRDVVQMRALQRVPGVTVQFAAVSPFVIGLLAGAGVCPASHVALLPNLVNAAYLDAGRRRLLDGDIIDQPRRLLYVGTDSYRKGFDVGIRMLNGIAAEHAIQSIRLAGFNPDRPPSIGADQDGERVAAGLRELGTLTNVQMLGRKDDLLEDYLAADVMVVPTRMESFGRVALEGAAAAVPIVCSNNPGHMTFLADDCAFVFQVGDAASGLDALRSAVVDHDERTRRRKRALSVAERYTWDVWRDAMSDVFDRPRQRA